MTSIKLKVVSPIRYEIRVLSDVEIRASSPQQVREIVHALSDTTILVIPDKVGDYELNFYPISKAKRS